MAKRLEEMQVWQEAKNLTVQIYSTLSACRDYGFKDQIQRASVSIMNNIAEGFEAGSNNMFVKYLNVAKGSCAEVRSMLILAEELKYIEKNTSEELIEKTLYISKGTSKLIAYLNTLNK